MALGAIGEVVLGATIVFAMTRKASVDHDLSASLHVDSGLDAACFDEAVECMIQKAKDEGSPDFARELEEACSDGDDASADPKAQSSHV